MSPSAAYRPCAGGCGKVVPSGKCQTCRGVENKREGSASSRGYGSRWVRFRPAFIGMLVQMGISPVCGAALPCGPKTVDSQCKAEGLINGIDLDLDHEPPLTDEERRDPAKVCDPLRIQLLCGPRCHAAKTRRQQLARNRPARREWTTDVGAQHG